jgi:hypothetical protein
MGCERRGWRARAVYLALRADVGGVGVLADVGDNAGLGEDDGWPAVPGVHTVPRRQWAVGTGRHGDLGGV